jgi:hypothetical protein
MSNTTTTSLTQPASKKLTRENFLLWKAQVVLIVCGARLYGYLDGIVVELALTDATHAAWVAQDQHVLDFINVSLSREVLGHVATCTTAVAVWKELNSMFASQSKARTIQIRTHLATTHKGDQTAAAYYNKMKGFTDEMVTIGKPLEDDDFISYVLAALDQDYNSFVENVAGKTEISLGGIYS